MYSFPKQTDAMARHRVSANVIPPHLLELRTQLHSATRIAFDQAACANDVGRMWALLEFGLGSAIHIRNVDGQTAVEVVLDSIYARLLLTRSFHEDYHSSQALLITPYTILVHMIQACKVV
jgi:hypothetical protein